MLVTCRRATLLAGLLLAVYATCASALSEPPSVGLLFEVRAENGAQSFVFGTIHSADPRVTTLPAPVAEAFASSRTLLLEMLPDATAILGAMVSMVYTDGRTLADVLDPALYARTITVLGRLGMPEAAIRDFKPWAVVTLLSVPHQESTEFLDLRLYHQGLAAGKPVRGLETAAEQIGVLEGLDEADQVSLLRATIESYDDMPRLFEQLITAYLARDLAGLARLGEQSFDGASDIAVQRFKTLALDRRNALMAERLAPHLAEGGCFVAVGALHLAGEDGVLMRLVRAGLAVRPVY